MNLSACGSLTTKAHTGVWYRAVPPQFWVNPLNTSHTQTIPSRFGAGSVIHPGFELLYLAENQIVALFEVNALLGSFHGTHLPNPWSVHTLIPAQVKLQLVADLTQASELRLIQTSVQELTGDWRGYRLRNSTQPPKPPHTEVPTQKFGDALNAVPSLEGFFTYSAKITTQKNLVVFPHKLQSGSSIIFTNPVTGTIVRIP